MFNFGDEEGWGIWKVPEIVLDKEFIQIVRGDVDKLKYS